MKPLSTRELLALAVPSMLSVILTHAYRSVDQYFIQFVSTDAQAAVGSSVFVLIALASPFYLAALGAGPLIARATGAGEPAARRRILGSGLSLAALTAIVMGAFMVLGGPWIAVAIGLEGGAAEECVRYLEALGWTLLPLALTPIVDQAFIAMGDTRTPMWLQGLSLLVNAGLTPLFVLGLEWGIVGAALASNLSRLLTTGLGFVLLVRRLDLGPADFRLDPIQLPRVIRVGFPMAMGTFLYAAVYWAMLKTSISPQGAHVNAALGIGFSALEGFTWPAFWGISIAVSSVVGRALGAGAPDVAWAAIRKAVWMSGAAGLAATLAFIFAGEFLTGLFTEDPRVHAAATEYAFILGFSQLFVAAEALSEGVLGGAGDTRRVFWLSVPFNILRIPLAWVLAEPAGMGAAGIWWAVNATTVAKAALKSHAAWRGKWVDLKI